MDPKWFPSADRPLRPSGGVDLVAIIAGTGLITLLLPQGSFRKLIAVPPILWALYNLRRHASPRPAEDYLTAVNVSLTLARFLDLGILHTPEHDFRRVAPNGDVRETAEEIQKMTLWQKFRWSVDLLSSMRGIGWNWRVKNVQEVPSITSRRRFVLEQLLRAAYCFLYIDIDEWYMHQTQSSPGTAPMADFFSLPVGYQAFLGWRTAFYSGFTMVLGYYLGAALAVGTGLYSPQAWPPLFGSFVTNGYTVRNMWGCCWHQLLRRIIETANSRLTSPLRIRRGTLTSRYLKIYNAFFVSALIHHIGALNSPYTPFVWCQFYFFMIQPVAITVEDLVIALGRRAGLKDTWMTRAVGYLWVSCFFSYSLRYAAAYTLNAGLAGFRHPLVAKYSIMDQVFV